jgi:hypothetical protein
MLWEKYFIQIIEKVDLSDEQIMQIKQASGLSCAT